MLRLLTSQSTSREYTPLAKASRALSARSAELGITSTLPFTNLELLHKAHPSFAGLMLKSSDTFVP